jgi:hypothetical protein
MPEDIVKFYNENGRDATKTREAFPDEFDIVATTVAGASALAQEALSLRRGLTKFNPEDSKHAYLDTFLNRQARALLAQGTAEMKTRDGKSFVHPYEMTPSLRKTHWTFDDEDVLGMLKSEAAREAKAGVERRRAGVKASVDAAAKRAAAPAGAIAPVVVAPPVNRPSTRTPPTVSAGAAVPAVVKTTSLSRMLGLG